MAKIAIVSGAQQAPVSRGDDPPYPPDKSCGCDAVALTLVAGSAHLDDGADFHGDPAAVDARPGLGDVDGLVDRVRLDHRVPAEHLLGLHERPVGHRARPDGLGRRDTLELVPAVQLPGRAPLLVPGADLR